MRMIFPMLRGLGVGEGDEEKIKKMINCSLRLKGKLRNLKGKDSRGSLFSMILVSEIIRMLKLAMRTNSSSSIELESTSNNRRLNAKKMKSPPKMITEKRLVREDLMDLLKALTRKISGENPTLMKEEEFKPQISSHVNLTIEFTEESDLLKIVNFLEKLETFLNNLVGALQILGVYYRFYDFFSPGYGSDGIPIAILSNNHPIGCLFVAILFGALRSGGSMMELMTGIPIDLSNVLEAVIIFFVTAKIILIFRKSKKGEVV